MKTDCKLFQEEIKKRGIQYLVHFTPTINLLSIFENGSMLSRTTLERKGIEQTDILDFIEFPDEIRFDDKNYINLSIQHPNSFLFRRFQEKTQAMPHINWCVLKIDPKYIYKKETIFSVTNAANTYNRRNIGVTGDYQKFKMLFEDNLQVVTTKSSRVLARNGLKAMYPTDEQAEVLVRDFIPLGDISQVCFKNTDDMIATKAALSEFNTDNFIIESHLFSNVRN